MRICVDAGHGGTDPGALGEISSESETNLAIALELEQVLLADGHEVLMTRRTDRTLALKARADFANRHDVDLFVSVHCNGAAAKSASGIEVFTFPNSRKSIEYAISVQKYLIKEFKRSKNRGVKEANFQVLRETAMPAILVECEFITNSSKEKNLNSPHVQYLYGWAIADGIWNA